MTPNYLGTYVILTLLLHKQKPQRAGASCRASSLGHVPSVDRSVGCASKELSAVLSCTMDATTSEEIVERMREQVPP